MALAEPHIVIDDDRYIAVPKKLRRLAVQHDHNVETVTFDCPRYWDGIDMSGMRIYINYVRADDYPGCYEVKNICIDESDETIMHFDWTITRNVTDYPGTLSFLVCIKTTDEDGNEIVHWNSELCTACRVSEGLECSEAVLDPYPDIVTQLKEEISTLIDEKFGNISGEINAAIDTKVDEAVDEALSNIGEKIGEEVIISETGEDTIEITLI